jgi:outer membrane protein TolC
MRRLSLMVMLLALPVSAPAAPLTADEAVRIALQHSTQIVQAEAGRLTARGDMWNAYAGVLPSVTGGITRSGSYTDKSTGTQAFGVQVFPSSTYRAEGYTTTTSVTGTWGIGRPSAWSNFSAARAGQSAANYSYSAARADVAYATRSQFYQVVQAMHQVGVNDQALRLARDSERRVRAMYEVGSVSKSDLLKAQVATSQAELDSLTAVNNVVNQRILLAQQMGQPESRVAEVDSTLSEAGVPVDQAEILAEAKKSRPDIRAAEANARASELDLRAARWERLPYLAVSGSWTPETRRSSKFFSSPSADTATSSFSKTTGSYGGSVSLNLDIFQLTTQAQVDAARGRMLTARETRDALLRNLEGEVHQAVLAYEQALEGVELANRTVASAAENQNLVQQKYNVGSATILDLIDSQVQLQRAQTTLVAAQASVRVAEDQLDRVRGRTP